MRNDVPCKDCYDRKVGCHSTCEKYNEFHKQCEIMRIKQNEINENTYRRPKDFQKKARGKISAFRCHKK